MALSSIVPDRTSSWTLLCGKQYRKFHMFNLLWDIDLDEYRVAAAPNGGPLAFVRREDIIIDVSAQSLKPHVLIFSSSGAELAAIPWDHRRIVAFGWTRLEQLCIVTSDGDVSLFDTQGALKRKIPLNLVDMVVEGSVWPTGVVVLTSTAQLVALHDFESAEGMLEMSGPVQPVVSMTVIEPQFTSSGFVDVIMTVDSGSVFVANFGSLSLERMSTLKGPFPKMSVTPNGRLVALCNEGHDLLVVTADFQKNLSERELYRASAPDQLVWCGTDALCMIWDTTLIMVGPYGEGDTQELGERAILVPEVDGVRIMTQTKCEFLQRVPDEVLKIFKLDTLDPAFTLYEAYLLFQQKSPKADENIRSILAELEEAVNTCLIAAAHEFDLDVQQELLSAASFGKCFLDSYPHNHFVEMCNSIRVLNAVRHEDVGMPLTFPQFQRLTMDVIVDRLVMRRQYFLALKIAESLKLSKTRVLVNWGCAMVRIANRKNDELMRIILEKLHDEPGVSYAEIADAAYTSNRKQLAVDLLEFEPVASEQVPLLLRFEQPEMALAKAVERGDTELVYLVLFRFLDRLHRGAMAADDFVRLLEQYPLAASLFMAYEKHSPREDDRMLLANYLRVTHRDNLAVILDLRNQVLSDDMNARRRCLQSANEFFEAVKDPHFSKLTRDQRNLLRTQEELDEAEQSAFPYLGLGLAETVFTLIERGKHKKAAQLAKDAGLSQEHFWWLKIRGLAAASDWQLLDRFAKDKKSPIGYEPFVEICLDHHRVDQAVEYMHKVTDLGRRVDLFLGVRRFNEAIDSCVAAKDWNRLRDVQGRCGVPAIADRIEDILRSVK